MAVPHDDPRYSWQLVQRIPVADSQKKHDLSRDGEIEVLSTEEGLGIELVQAPMTTGERDEVTALAHVVQVTEGGYAQAYAVSPGLSMHEVPKAWASLRARTTRATALVAVLDTGCDRSFHPYFASISGQSFVAGEYWNSDRVSGHGTHVAGTVAANRTVGGLEVGVAPDAAVLAYKVLSDSGSGSYAGIIKGLERAVAAGVDVINLSLGGPGDKDHPLSKAVDAAARSAVVCVAAGNEQQGTSAYMADQSTPASAREAVTVGAVDSSRRRAPFSNIGEAVDIAAHGVNVPSLGGSLSGSSMASPHVAGIAALLSATGRSPAEVRQALLSGATNTPLGVLEEGYGIASAPGALERLTGTPASSKALAAHMSTCMKECWRAYKQRSKV